MMAVVLVFATVAGNVPSTAVFAASRSTMDCCAGGMGGETGNSCPLHNAKHLKPARLEKPAQSEPMCHTGSAAQKTHTSASHEHHATPAQAAHAGHGEARSVEHASDQHVSIQNTRTETANSLAAVSKPCASDCCKRANSWTQTQRPRDEAALSDKLRPRRARTGVNERASDAVSGNASKARRQCPPRAPPSSLNSLSA